MTGLPNKDGAYWFQFNDFPVIVRKMPDWEEHKAFLNGTWYPVSTLAKGWWVGPLQKPGHREEVAKDRSPHSPYSVSNLLRYIQLRDDLLNRRDLGHEDDEALLDEMDEVWNKFSGSELTSLRMYVCVEEQVKSWEKGAAECSPVT